MKYVLFVGLACAALATGCASSLPTSAVVTTSASVPATVTGTSRASSTDTAGVAKNETRVASRRPESSLRRTAAEKSRCESGDDSACLVAGSFER
jgi:hypothetical protein